MFNFIFGFFCGVSLLLVIGIILARRKGDKMISELDKYHSEVIEKRRQREIEKLKKIMFDERN